MQSSFQELQAYWYAKLKESGFEDIEDSDPDPRIKRWTGVMASASRFGPNPLMDVVEGEGTLFPEALYTLEEQFSYSPDFTLACQSVCRHGNHKLTAHIVAQIWEHFICGGSERKIAGFLNINHTAVHRTIVSLREWMNVMNTEEQEPEKEVTIVVRDVNWDRDVGDIGMILATWRNHLWYDEPRDESKADEFFRTATRNIKKVIRHPDTRIKVACLKDDPIIIIGYAVINKKNLEWAYVKIDYREKGIATMLAKGCDTISEPMTKIGKGIAFNHDFKIKK